MVWRMRVILTRFSLGSAGGGGAAVGAAAAAGVGVGGDGAAVSAAAGAASAGAGSAGAASAGAGSPSPTASEKNFAPTSTCGRGWWRVDRPSVGLRPSPRVLGRAHCVSLGDEELLDGARLGRAGLDGDLVRLDLGDHPLRIHVLARVLHDREDRPLRDRVAHGGDGHLLGRPAAHEGAPRLPQDPPRRGQRGRRAGPARVARRRGRDTASQPPDHQLCRDCAAPSASRARRRVCHVDDSRF